MKPFSILALDGDGFDTLTEAKAAADSLAVTISKANPYHSMSLSVLGSDGVIVYKVRAVGGRIEPPEDHLCPACGQKLKPRAPKKRGPTKNDGP